MNKRDEYIVCVCQNEMKERWQQGQEGKQRRVAVCRVKVRVTQTRGLDGRSTYYTAGRVHIFSFCKRYIFFFFSGRL